MAQWLWYKLLFVFQDGRYGSSISVFSFTRAARWLSALKKITKTGLLTVISDQMMNVFVFIST